MIYRHTHARGRDQFQRGWLKKKQAGGCVCVCVCVETLTLAQFIPFPLINPAYPSSLYIRTLHTGGGGGREAGGKIQRHVV